jgi:phosphatidylserine/phosphatidylglycerophosphate/cardiolipin synthase-like enzyme
VTDAIVKLANHDLLILADALRSARLQPPFTDLAVARYAPYAAASDVATCLRSLQSSGISTDGLTLFLDTLLRDRALRPSAEEVIDLVSTGPETHASPNRDTRVVVSELFGAASESVTVVGFAVYQGRQVFAALAQRMERVPVLRVRMFLDVQRALQDTSIDDDILLRFTHRFRTREWPGATLPEVFYDPRSLLTDGEQRASLHAKCIVVDRSVTFISSANFTSAAQLKNIEIGVLIRSPMFSGRLEDHFDTLAAAGILRRVPGL